MTPGDEQVGDALSEVERLYSGGLRSHGIGPRSVGWKDEDSQLLRFAKLAQVLTPLPDRPLVVNDLGCGYGALFQYLDQKQGMKLAEYHGYDISAPMLEAARERTDSRARLVLGSEIDNLADYSFVSGTFNVKGTSDNEPWARYVEDCLVTLGQTSRHGFAFNILTTFVDYRQEHLFYADPCAFFSFCKRRISPYVTLLHDYPLYEWTMLVRLPVAHG